MHLLCQSLSAISLKISLNPPSVLNCENTDDTLVAMSSKPVWF